MAKPPQITPEEVFETCFTDLPDRCEPRHAPEVAEMVGCSADTARENLKILVDHGELRSKKIGSLVFWRPCYTEDV